VKTLIVFVLALSLIVVLSACAYPGTVVATGYYAPYCILEDNAPFADNLHAHQFDYVEELEQDDFGRRYYSYTTPSRTFACDLEIHVICQTVTEDAQYGYYQDDCYMIRKESDDPFSDEAISAFKARNEWNLPLTHEKVRYVNRDDYNTWIIGERDVTEHLLVYLKLENAFVIVNAMEPISDSEQLYFAYVGSKENPDQEQLGAYLLLCKKNSPNLIVQCQKIEMDPNCQDAVSTFRKAIQDGERFSVLSRKVAETSDNATD
jgi:hypothetical protein